MTAFVKTHRVQPVYLVLTQTHRKETRKQSIKRLKDAFNNLVRREFWKEHFKGGTWSVELTKDAEGLHQVELLTSYALRLFYFKFCKNRDKEDLLFFHVLL